MTLALPERTIAESVLPEQRAAFDADDFLLRTTDKSYLHPGKLKLDLPESADIKYYVAVDGKQYGLFDSNKMALKMSAKCVAKNTMHNRVNVLTYDGYMSALNVDNGAHAVHNRQFRHASTRNDAGTHSRMTVTTINKLNIWGYVPIKRRFYDNQRSKPHRIIPDFSDRYIAECDDDDDGK